MGGSFCSRFERWHHIETNVDLVATIRQAPAAGAFGAGDERPGKCVGGHKRPGFFTEGVAGRPREIEPGIGQRRFVEGVKQGIAGFIRRLDRWIVIEVEAIDLYTFQLVSRAQRLRFALRIW